MCLFDVQIKNVHWDRYVELFSVKQVSFKVREVNSILWYCVYDAQHEVCVRDEL